MKRLVLASNNAGKLREFSQLLAPFGFEVIPQAALGVPEAPEPHPTFVENALAKARHASQLTGLPALADDSGLCVNALDGAPGVYSARFSAREGGEPGDAANNAFLMQKLQGVADRRARYVALLVMVRSATDPQPLIGEGLWHGTIAEQPRGEHGFGYDPYFVPEGDGRSAAELTPAEKNQRSHRALALKALLAGLDTAGGADAHDTHR
jgi:XTP/dITP diphosphohydrolase